MAGLDRAMPVWASGGDGPILICACNDGTNHEIRCFENWAGSQAGLGSAWFQNWVLKG